MDVNSDMQAVIEAVEGGQEAQTIQIPRVGHENGLVLVVPEGKKVADLRPFLRERLERPERRLGIANFTVLESLIAHANRYKDEHTVIFADDTPERPSISVVLNYNELGASGEPRFGDHRGHYAFPISEEWTFWKGVHGKTLDQGAFAALLEGRITDVLEPGSVGDATKELANEIGITPLAGRSALKTLSKGLTVHVDSKVTNKVNLDTGESQILFSEQHNDDQGQPIKVPNGFVIAIPIFRGGERYAIAVRLRYRAGGGKVSWSMELHRADVAFREMFTESCAKAQAETGLPLLYGRPEA